MTTAWMKTTVGIVPCDDHTPLYIGHPPMLRAERLRDRRIYKAGRFTVIPSASISSGVALRLTVPSGNS